MTETDPGFTDADGRLVRRCWNCGVLRYVGYDCLSCHDPASGGHPNNWKARAKDGPNDEGCTPGGWAKSPT